MTELNDKKHSKKTSLGLRIMLEVGLTIFLFYTNLLMGEYNGSGLGRLHGLLWALNDIFTMKNFGIAITFAFIGELIFRFLFNKIE